MSLRLGQSIRRFAAAVMAFKIEKTPIVKFNNGIEFPIFGLGTWKVSHSVYECVGFSCRPAYVSLINIYFTIFKAHFSSLSLFLVIDPLILSYDSRLSRMGEFFVVHRCLSLGTKELHVKHLTIQYTNGILCSYVLQTSPV